MQNTESDIRNRINEQYGDIIDNNAECKFPKYMMLELTNACNDSCLFCLNSKCTRKKGFIAPAFAERILKEAYDMGTREVGLFMTGESLLDPNLERYISFAKNLGYEYVYITTNGALLTRERAESIVDAGIDSIKFSINASDPKDYLLIHGRDDFDKVIENLIYLDTLRKNGGRKFFLYISYVVTRYSQAGKDDFVHKYEKYVDDILFYNCGDQGGLMKNEIPHLEIEADSQFSAPGICPRPFNKLFVTYEGYLTLCCVDFQNYLIAADLNKESLKDAWNNQYAKSLREKHLQHDLKGTVCGNCWANCNERAEPLRKEYAALIDWDNWDNSGEITKRIDKWNKNEQ